MFSESGLCCCCHTHFQCPMLQLVMFVSSHCSVESDSEVDFRKRDRAPSQESDSSLRDAYRSIQKGGDVPMGGLRYPVPGKRGKNKTAETMIVWESLRAESGMVWWALE